MKVYATKIDKIHIFFNCPHCSKYTFNNGRLRKKPYIKEHLHGSSGDLSNRIEDRIPHCIEAKTRNFIIHVTDDTIRK
jgi:hypothetical protein